MLKTSNLLISTDYTFKPPNHYLMQLIVKCNLFYKIIFPFSLFTFMLDQLFNIVIFNMLLILIFVISVQVEPHYGTEYHVDRISEETLSQWRNAGHNPAFSLPPPNPLICTSPNSSTVAKPSRNFRQPELFCLLDRIRTRCWFMPDFRFLVPKCFIYLKYSSSTAYHSPRDCNLNNLLVYAVRDQLVEFNYTAMTAGRYIYRVSHSYRLL